MFKFLKSFKSDDRDQSTGDESSTSSRGRKSRDNGSGKTSDSAHSAGNQHNTSASGSQPRDSGSRKTSKSASERKPVGDRRSTSSSKKKPFGSTGQRNKPETSGRMRHEPHATRSSSSTPRPPRSDPSSTEARNYTLCKGLGHGLPPCSVDEVCLGCELCEGGLPPVCPMCKPGPRDPNRRKQVWIGACSRPGYSHDCEVSE